MTDAPNAVPTYLLELYALGELPPDEQEALAHRLRTDRRLRERFESLHRSNEEILEATPPEVFAAEVTRRVDAADAAPAAEGPAPARQAPRWMLLAPAVAAAAVLLLLVVRPDRTPPVPEAPSVAATATETTRAKGETHLRLYRRAGEGFDALADGDVARAGDVLQLGVVPLAARHAVILSIDGRGEVVLHFPATARGSTQLAEGGEQLLPHAYELDDAPDFERFFLITSEGPIDAAAVLAAARELARSPERAAHDLLALPDGLDQHARILRKKESRP